MSVYVCLSYLSCNFHSEINLSFKMHCVMVLIEMEHIKQQFSFVTLMTRHIYTDEPDQHRFIYKQKD